MNYRLLTHDVGGQFANDYIWNRGIEEYELKDKKERTGPGSSFGRASASRSRGFKPRPGHTNVSLKMVLAASRFGVELGLVDPE